MKPLLALSRHTCVLCALLLVPDAHSKSTSFSQFIKSDGGNAGGVLEPPEPIEKYVGCPALVGNTTSLESVSQYMLRVLRDAPVYTEPILHTHFCNLFPPSLYDIIRRNWPPIKMMYQGGTQTGIHNMHPDKRFKMSVYTLLDSAKKPKSKLSKKWKGWKEMYTIARVWEQIDSVMFSKEFTDLLLAKFGLTGATQAHHDNRMQTDRSGYSVGVHADSVRKLITMQFYFPLNTQSELFYGTCVHSQEQFDNRDQKCNGCAPCYKKFKFQYNAGYAFPVHNTSFHSAPAVIQGLGERRTALLNIYKTDIGKSRGRVGG